MGVGIALLALMMLLVGILGLALSRRTSYTTRAQVHVDDLVTGHIPPVCAVSGVPTSHLVPVESSRGGSQAWWALLLFLGPVGIAAIAVLYVIGGRVQRVSGVLPIAPEAVDRYLEALAVARRSTWALVTLVVVGLFGVFLIDPRTSGPAVALAVIVTACMVTVIGANVIAPTRWIDLQLDGSGRWVVIDRAHPAFAQAVYDNYRNRDSSFR